MTSQGRRIGQARQWGSDRDHLLCHSEKEDSLNPLLVDQLQKMEYSLRVLQQPHICKVSNPTEKAKASLEPPPVIEIVPTNERTKYVTFTLGDGDDTHSRSDTFLSSPFFFASVQIIPISLHPNPKGRPQEQDLKQSALIGGTVVSSLHRVKLESNREHGIFVFHDINIRVAGKFRLKCSLFEMHKTDKGGIHAVKLQSIETKEFTAFWPQKFQGQPESTPLSRILSDSGIKLRIRKETSRRKSHTQDWSADHSTGYAQRPCIPSQPQHNTHPDTIHANVYSKGHEHPANRRKITHNGHTSPIYGINHGDSAMTVDRASYNGPVEARNLGQFGPPSYTSMSLPPSATAYSTEPQFIQRPSLPHPIDVVTERQRRTSGPDPYGAFSESASLESRTSVTSPQYLENYDPTRRNSVIMEPSSGHGHGAPNRETSNYDRSSHDPRYVATLGQQWDESRVNLPPLHRNFVGLSAPATAIDTVTSRYPDHHGRLEHSRPILPQPAPGVMPMYRYTPVSYPPHGVPPYQGPDDGTKDYSGHPRGPHI